MGNHLQLEERRQADWQACNSKAKGVRAKDQGRTSKGRTLGSIRHFEELQIGRGFLVGLLKFHKGEWLTPEEKEALIRSISRRLNEFYAHEGGRYYYSLTREEKLTNARAEQRLPGRGSCGRAVFFAKLAIVRRNGPIQLKIQNAKPRSSAEEAAK